MTKYELSDELKETIIRRREDKLTAYKVRVVERVAFKVVVHAWDEKHALDKAKDYIGFEGAMEELDRELITVEVIK